MTDVISKIEMDELLEEVVKRVHDLYGSHLKEVLLYGSYAKEEADEESDIDIMILVDIEEDKKRNFDQALTKVSADIGYKYMKVISLMDVDYYRFINWSEVLPFYKNVITEGVVLYGR